MTEKLYAMSAKKERTSIVSLLAFQQRHAVLLLEPGKHFRLETNSLNGNKLFAEWLIFKG